MRTRLLVGLVVVALLVGGFLTFRPGSGDGERELTATFPSTVNLYEGAQVKVLGVRVGTVTSVEVVGTSVQVRMTYDDDVRLPADVQAVIVPPSIVGDRFVQLTPAYPGTGPVLADGAEIALADTAVPVELDETYRQLTALTKALGPEGLNRDGDLSRLVRATARALDGNGRLFNGTVRRLARALDTLAAVDPAYQGTVSNAEAVTRTLVENDAAVRRLVLLLARVSGQLNAQRDDIGRAARELDGALGEVAAFVRENRRAVKNGVTGLEDVSRTLLRRTHELQDLLALAPVGFVSAMNINLPTNWSFEDPGASTPRGRTTSYLQRGVYTSNLGVTLGAILANVCDTVTGPRAAQLAPLCLALTAVGNDLGLLLMELTTLSLQTPPGSLTQAELIAKLAAAAKGAGR